MKSNKGLEFEKVMINRTHGKKNADKRSDIISKAGRTSEAKYIRIEKREDAHDIYNSAHAHKWILNENGEKDYLLTVEAMVNEADRVIYSVGNTAKEKAVYLTKKADRFNFYYTRLQWQNEKHGRLCPNPLSTKAGGRARQLETLKKNGVVNVPTMEEIRKACEA